MRANDLPLEKTGIVPVAPTWHQRSADEALQVLGTTRTGLSQTEAEMRLRKYGPNELVEHGGRTVWMIVREQLSSVMIVILLVAGVLALVVKGGDGFPVDAVAIFSIVVLFVVLGVAQEYRAQKAIAALKQMSAPTVRVLRDGQVSELSARSLVRGDIVRLETGSVVPADCRMVDSVNLRIQEAALTGESEPIDKCTAALMHADLALGDRRNMGYLGTFVSYGRGSAVVVGTGMDTEIGRIAALLQSVPHAPTPLQRKLDGLGKVLAAVAVVVALLVGLIGYYVEGQPLGAVLIIAIAIAVAIVPEGLPAVQTFTLALGAQRMLARKALIRKLPAVETLGSVTVICSDKTGTLTQNRMTVTTLVTLDTRLDLAPGQECPTEAQQDHGLGLLLAGGALCNDAILCDDGKGVGDPTEVALVVAAAHCGWSKTGLDESLPRVYEIGFDADRKRMTTVHDLQATQEPLGALQGWANAAGARFAAVTKGAADQLLSISTHAWVEGRIVPMTDALRERAELDTRSLAAQGIRVLGLGMRGLNVAPQLLDLAELERELVFIGLVGMIDPPRPEVRDAISRCTTAGIRTVMITGDHPETARYIAAELGITGRNARVLTGLELERLTVAELEAQVDMIAVYARVSPEHKLRIVCALQNRGHVVAMTGDGVNDAPALRRADIGVAMGITGTDVAKEAADMVLLDDNFATIVAAVEEGRVVYDNLRRFLMFSISGNVAKVMVVAIPPLIAMAAMLRPIQILFSNLLTDGLLGLGMGVEAKERDTMRRPPYSPKESVFSRGVGWHIAVVGPVIGLMLIGYGWWHWRAMGMTGPDDPNLVAWGTLMFMTMAGMQIGRALASRSFREPFWTLPLASNRVLLWMLLAVVVLQLAAVFTPVLNTFFGAVPMTLGHMLHATGFALVVLVLMEVEKAVRRRLVPA